MVGAWKLPTTRTPTETEEQQDFVRWFRRTYPGVRIFHVPNGDGRSKAAGLKLKTMGVSKGVPDLFVPAWLLWVEFKRSDGVASDVDRDQRGWHAYLRECGAGYTVEVANGSTHAQDIVDAFVVRTGRQGERAA